jgi:transposase-like protein
MKAEDKIVGSHSAMHCPICKIGELQRIKRKGLAVWIPRSRRYQCTKCRVKFLRVLDLFTFRIRKAPGKKELAITTVGIIATIYLSYKLVIAMYTE